MIRAERSITIDGAIVGRQIDRTNHGASITLIAGESITINGGIQAGPGDPGSVPAEDGGNGGSIRLDAPLIVVRQPVLHGGEGGPGSSLDPDAHGGDGGNGGDCIVRGVIMTTTGAPISLVGGNGGRGGWGGAPTADQSAGDAGSGGRGGDGPRPGFGGDPGSNNHVIGGNGGIPGTGRGGGNGGNGGSAMRGNPARGGSDGGPCRSTDQDNP